MLWARVIRGISSMARNVTPRAARERAASNAVSGSPKPITVWPGRIIARSAAPVSGLAPGARTCSSTSAARNTSSRAAVLTPFSTYSLSGKPAAAPAFVSITRSIPVLWNTESAFGAIATRRSPGDVSETNPAVMGLGSQEVGRGEEEAELGFGRLRCVGSVNRVAFDIGGEAFADGAVGRIGRIGRAHHFAKLFDGVLALQCQHDDRPFRHEFHEPVKEGTCAVDCVKCLRLRLAQPRHAHSQNLETGLLQLRKNRARVSGCDSIRLDNRKSAFNAHKRDLTVSPRVAGVGHTVMPAASMAAILSLALPLPPAMIAPAWPMRRPGGAVCPAMKPTTGFFTYCLMYAAAVSSALPPISPIMMMACVSGSSLKSSSASTKLVPIMGSPPMPMQVDWPIPSLVNCPTAS